jgi:hypothetical protein
VTIQWWERWGAMNIQDDITSDEPLPVGHGLRLTCIFYTHSSFVLRTGSSGSIVVTPVVSYITTLWQSYVFPRD